MMTLGVNVDHVATVRQQRRGCQPDPVEMAMLAEAAGANVIVCHLREDRRHIQDQDVYLLKERVQHLNIEISLSVDMIDVVVAVAPDRVTFVPEKRQEITTERGLNVLQCTTLQAAVDRCHAQKIRVAVFIDPDMRQIDAAIKQGVDVIELNTGMYANSVPHAAEAIAQLQAAAAYIGPTGLFVAAGHGLDYGTVHDVVAIREICELNIGFSIVSRAIHTGWTCAVETMAALLHRRST